MKKKILFTLVLFFAAFAVVSVVRTNAASVTGWLWGGSEEAADATINGNETGLGWISMSSKNCDTDSNGVNDACDLSGDGLVNATDFTAMVSYGVDIPSDNSAITGTAWSPNLGAISFNTADVAGCPRTFGDGSCYARNNGGKIEGWARILNIRDAGANAGGWEGWIAMGEPFNGAGRSITLAAGNLAGYGYSASSSGNPELGWIDFSGADSTPDPILTVDFTGSGMGSVSGTGGLSCVGDCTKSYSGGTVVTATATANGGSNFIGWTGCDSVSGADCTATIGADRTILPQFDIACLPSSSCAADTCEGQTCADGCGGTVDGTKSCTSGTGNWREVAP